MEWLAELGSAGAAIVVVILFLKSARETSIRHAATLEQLSQRHEEAVRVLTEQYIAMLENHLSRVTEAMGEMTDVLTHLVTEVKRCHTTRGD